MLARCSLGFDVCMVVMCHDLDRIGSDLMRVMCIACANFKMKRQPSHTQNKQILSGIRALIYDSEIMIDAHFILWFSCIHLDFPLWHTNIIIFFRNYSENARKQFDSLID